MENYCIKLKDISSFLVDVSEEISQNNLTTFISTSFKSLNSNNSNDFNKSKIFYSYLDLSNEYQILSYQSSIIKATQIELLSENLDSKSLNLVIFEDFYLLFRGKNFYFLQNMISELKDDDLNIYIKKRFNFDIEKQYFLSKDDLIKDNSQIKNRLKYINNNKSLNIFYLYSFLLLLIFIFFTFYINYDKSYEKRKSLANIELKKIKNVQVLEEQLYKKLVVLLNDISSNNINVHKVEYKQKSISLKLSSINEKNLYKFFKKYKNIRIDFLKYIESKKHYETSILFSF